MTNVVPLPGFDPDQCGERADPSVVELLREWLMMAERGEIVCAAICATDARNSVVSASAGGRATTIDLLVAVTVLRLRVEDDYRERRD